MNKLETSIKMEVDERFPEQLTAKQGDVSSRVLKVQLMRGAEPFSLEQVAAARIFVQKPDGHCVYNDAQIVSASEGKLEAPLSGQTLAAPGLASCELVLLGGEGAVLSTIPFSLRVIASVRDAQAEPSTEECTGFDALFQSRLEALEALNERGEALLGETRKNRGEAEQAALTAVGAAQSVQQLWQELERMTQSGLDIDCGDWDAEPIRADVERKKIQYD